MPLYEYEHNLEKPADTCPHIFEIFQNINDPLLKKCPHCGADCHRVFSSFANPKSTKDLLSPKNLEKHGFTQYKKAGKGHYEKTAGDGPKTISQ